MELNKYGIQPGKKQSPRQTEKILKNELGESFCKVHSKYWEAELSEEEAESLRRLGITVTIFH